MSRWPAVVVSYDRPSRQCVVSMEGITSGADGLVAEIEQNLGDRSEHSEIRILPGDRVWVDFLAGDPRYPIITGFRARNAENMVGTRHWEHENFTLVADETQAFTAGTSITHQAGQAITLTAGSKIELIVGGTSVTLTADSITQIAAAIALNGPVTQAGGDMTSDGKSMQTHTHMEQGDGAATSGPL